MEELNESEVEAVSGGDAIETTAGIVTGAVVGLLVIGGGGGLAVGALAGGIIWSGGSFILRYLR